MLRPLLCALALLCSACDPGAPAASQAPASPPPASPASAGGDDYSGSFDFEAVVSLDPPAAQGAETFAVRGAEQLRAVQASLGPDDPLRKLTLGEGQTLLIVARPGADSAPPSPGPPSPGRAMPPISMATSLADCHRRSGSFSRHRFTSRSNRSGAADRSPIGGAGSEPMIAEMRSAWLFP